MTEMIRAAIVAQTGGFTLQDPIKACPGEHKIHPL